MDQIQQLQKEVDGIKQKVGKIYDALVGNDIEKDGGLVERINKIDNDVHELKKFKDRFLWTVGIVAFIGTGFGFVVEILLRTIFK